MNKKSLTILISVIAGIAAAVTAVIVFRRQIAGFIESIRARRAKVREPQPVFTQEERESFADI